MLAAKCYPGAFAILETEQLKLAKQRLVFDEQQKTFDQKAKQDSERLERERQRLGRISKRLLNQDRRTWAFRIWFVKDLTSNALFVTVVLLVGMLLGVVIGVNLPNNVLCQQGSLCDRLRFQERKLLY